MTCECWVGAVYIGKQESHTSWVTFGVELEENEEVSTVTISARSESPEQGGCLTCSMRYREMPVDRAYEQLEDWQ